VSRVRQAHPVHVPERVEVYAPRYELALFPVLVIVVLFIVVATWGQGTPG
jgi:hypothetical protein